MLTLPDLVDRHTAFVRDNIVKKRNHIRPSHGDIDEFKELAKELDFFYKHFQESHPELPQLDSSRTLYLNAYVNGEDGVAGEVNYGLAICKTETRRRNYEKALGVAVRVYQTLMNGPIKLNSEPFEELGAALRKYLDKDEKALTELLDQDALRNGKSADQFIGDTLGFLYPYVATVAKYCPGLEQEMRTIQGYDNTYIGRLLKAGHKDEAIAVVADFADHIAENYNAPEAREIGEQLRENGQEMSAQEIIEAKATLNGKITAEGFSNYICRLKGTANEMGITTLYHLVSGAVNEVMNVYRDCATKEMDFLHNLKNKLAGNGVQSSPRA